jgi:hypothetical protein
VKPSSKWFSYLLLAAFVGGAGCAHRTEVQKTDTVLLKGNVRADNVYFKDFTSESSVQPPAGALAASQETAISYLKEKALFKEVDKYREGSSAADAMIVEAHLLDVRIVSGAARLWGGAFAGRSHMKMKVRLLDGASGSVIAEQELLGAPSAMGSAYSAGGTDRNLPIAMGRLIGEFVLANAGKQ